ncbi:MAG TPA: ABC transporter ATP-binding protein [Chitinophagaceae bacterium]|nr:ABC transporter ATP-binding protein [Chitinophagaceae bacterium]
METILKASSIIKYFKEPEPFQVLDNVNFEVKKGEFLSIVGKSGCGKSTLLYILSTMDTDYSGRLEIKSEALTGKSQNALAAFRNAHLGFVFQFHYLLPEFTVLKNVMLPALKLGRFSKAELEEKALAKLRLVGMDMHAAKMASRLSGGQQQRVAIARALINEPDIIMGDEPTGNLDKTNSQRVFEIFKQLSVENGQTIITVTHDTDFAQRSDRVIEMQDGQILRA